MFTYKTNNRKVILFQFWNIPLFTPQTQGTPSPKSASANLVKGQLYSVREARCYADPQPPEPHPHPPEAAGFGVSTG